MITIKEIAAQLNMSTTTVSNVIHGKDREVSEEKRAIVREFLDKVDYVPNINARNLAQNESKIIGVALKARADKYENLIMDPFVSELIGGIEETIRNAGYFMMLYISRDTEKIISFPSFKRTIEDMAVGQTMPNLNVPIVSDFQIIKPPKKVQDDYYTFVEQVDKSKVAVQRALEETQTLFDSLMQEYFG